VELVEAARVHKPVLVLMGQLILAEGAVAQGLLALLLVPEPLVVRS
jgi:hypothetical protein